MPRNRKPAPYRDFQDLTPQQQHRLAYRRAAQHSGQGSLAAWLLAARIRPNAANLAACSNHAIPERQYATPGRSSRYNRYHDPAKLLLPQGTPYERLQQRRINQWHEFRRNRRITTNHSIPPDVIFAPNPTPEAALGKSDAHIPIAQIIRDFALVNEAIPLDEKLILAYRPFRVTQDNIEIYRVAVLGKKDVSLGYAGVYHWQQGSSGRRIASANDALRTEYAVHLNTLIQKIEAKYRNDVATLLRSA